MLKYNLSNSSIHGVKLNQLSRLAIAFGGQHIDRLIRQFRWDLEFGTLGQPTSGTTWTTNGRDEWR